MKVTNKRCIECEHRSTLFDDEPCRSCHAIFRSTGEKPYFVEEQKKEEKWQDKAFKPEAKFRFAVLLETMMRHKGLKKAEIADCTGLSRAAISKYTYGTSLPTVGIFARIVNAMDCTDEEIRQLLQPFLDEE